MKDRQYFRCCAVFAAHITKQEKLCLKWSVLCILNTILSGKSRLCMCVCVCACAGAFIERGLNLKKNICFFAVLCAMFQYVIIFINQHVASLPLYIKAQKLVVFWITTHMTFFSLWMLSLQFQFLVGGSSRVGTSWCSVNPKILQYSTNVRFMCLNTRREREENKFESLLVLLWDQLWPKWDKHLVIF